MINLIPKLKLVGNFVNVHQIERIRNGIKKRWEKILSKLRSKGKTIFPAKDDYFPYYIKYIQIVIML